ncbi:hypothetical protein [Spiroplasma endosymbiont of Lariophagus distinguendus]|uniref:hypothetical protein n=1 Tax=Spiroplasma endosymbiont of Lariophagus distinguendus TaxID=2935082 RepID=UPI00207A06A5|nr:hypothetical protein [Spiroplasma endosymbiont of Lariophagus distinguendus]
MKIKINKITWIKIFILFFLIKEKSIFIEKITELFKNFWNRTSTKLEEEDLTSFSHLIWANANIYYDIFQKLEKNECIRINSYMGYPEGYWTTEKFNDYNEIVDKNNDVIDWTTFNDRNQNQKVTDEDKWWLKSAVDLRKKRSDNWKNMWWPFNESNFIFDNLPNVLTNTDGLYLENLSNLTPEIIIQTLSYNNPLLDVSQISVNINEKKGIINIKPSFLSKYIGSVEIHLSNKSKKNESKKMNFNFKQLRLINNQYDVLGDGNCLFWSVATAYLLQVRTDDVNFENRFIQLFGLKNKKYLRKTQNLLKIFDLRNYDANQDWYRNPISETLISDFRIRVIRYIHTHLDDNHIQNSRAIFRNAIIQEEEAFRREEAERNKIQFSVSEEERRNFAISYLERMMEPQQWGGSIEIEAMTDLLNTNIMVNDIRFEPDIETENSIQLFHINENHYNFGLSNIIENLEESIVNDNLGFISDNNEDTILQRLQELNPGLDINQIYMGKIDNNDSTVEIYSKSHSNYIGQKLIAFNLKSSNRNKKMKCNRYISSIIVNNDLGFISDNNEDTILQRLQELNPELDINQIYMGKIDNNDSTVEIYSKSHSNYIGRKLINFKIKISKPQKDKKTEKLTDIIKNTDLGFISNSLPQVIKNRLQELNPGLDINQIYISKISKNIAEVKSNFYLDKILVKFISNIKPPEGQWESQNVDLNQLMPIPMKYQKKDFWCSLAVLENLLVNLSNKSNTKLSQDYLYNYFDKLNLNPDHDTGILLYNIYKFLSKHKDLNFSYSHINFENKFWKTLSENETKILWVQYLIWNSLKMNIPVIANTILNKNEGHSILIIGIEPNIDDPFKTQYVIRDSGVNENEPTERKMIAIDLFSMFFNPYLCFGEMLIGSTVATKFFISHLIVEHLKVDSINFQNLIENLNEFSSDELETLLSTDDTICTSEAEQKLLNLFNEDKNE